MKKKAILVNVEAKEEIYQNLIKKKSVDKFFWYGSWLLLLCIVIGTVVMNCVWSLAALGTRSQRKTTGFYPSTYPTIP
jgi:hypothetical protein